MRAAAIFFILCLFFAFPARAADIGTVTLVSSTCNSLTVKAHIWLLEWKPSPKPNDSTYKAYNFNNLLSPVWVASSNSDTLHVPNLQPQTSYRIMVYARSRPAEGLGFSQYRKVGEVTPTTPACPQPVAGDVRLRHEATGKCLYGSPTEGGIPGTFTCWHDPEMAVSLEKVNSSGTEVRIRIRARGKCVFGNPTNGGVVRNHTCWDDPNMVYVKDPVGNVADNRWRLRHKNTGNCMYTGANNGDPARNFTCWPDPAMVWIIDPF